MRVLAFVLALAAGPAVAQSWTAEVTLDAGERRELSHAGSFTGLMTFDPEGEWFAGDVFVDEVGGQVPDCADITEMTVDFYSGVDGDYAIQVIVDLNKEAAGTWRVSEPGLFYSDVDAGENVEAGYEAYADRAKVRVADLACDGADRVRMTLSFAAQMDRFEGTGPVSAKMAGTVNGSAVIRSMEEY